MARECIRVDDASRVQMCVSPERSDGTGRPMPLVFIVLIDDLAAILVRRRGWVTMIVEAPVCPAADGAGRDAPAS